MTWWFDNRKNPFLFRDSIFKLIESDNSFLFRDSIFKLIESDNLEYKELTAKTE